MLRTLVIGIGLVMLMVALYCFGDGETRSAIWLAGNGAVLAFSVIFERWRYSQGIRALAHQQFVPTGEQFLDPETDALIEVHFNPLTGERHYVSTGRTLRAR
jgi:hypothetical protein